MAVINHWPLNSQPYAQATFSQVSNGAVYDPSGTIRCIVRTPDGNDRTYVYLTDAALTRLSTGIYRLTLTVTQVGTYGFHFYSDGATDAAACDDHYIVDAPPT